MFRAESKFMFYLLKKEVASVGVDVVSHLPSSQGGVFSLMPTAT